MADQNTADTQSAPARSRVTLAERHMNPEDMVGHHVQSKTMLFGVLAIVATVIFVVLVLLLWTERTKLSAI